MLKFYQISCPKFDPSVYFIGCPCHIVHNATQKGIDAFCDKSGFDIEECCIGQFYWFDKSTKCKGQMQEYASFCDMQYREYIKHLNVCWLTLEKAVERLLVLFPSYFKSEAEKQSRFLRLANTPMFEIYLLFFQAVLPMFTTFNLFLQRDDLQIYLLNSQMHSLLLKNITKFVSSGIIQSFRPTLKSIPYNDSINHLDDSKIFIGILKRSTIQKKLEEGDITSSDVRLFFSSVQAFYTSSVSYLCKWFPLDEPIILN